jgi:hypothetical protein
MVMRIHMGTPYVSSLWFSWLIIVFHVDWFLYISSVRFAWLIIVFQIDWFPYVSSLRFGWLIIVFQVDWFPYVSSFRFGWLIIVFQIDWFPYVSSLRFGWIKWYQNIAILCFVVIEISIYRPISVTCLYILMSRLSTFHGHVYIAPIMLIPSIYYSEINSYIKILWQSI